MKPATGPKRRTIENRSSGNGDRRWKPGAIVAASLLALSVAGTADTASTQTGVFPPGAGPGQWVQVPAGPGGGPMPPTPPGAGAGHWQLVPGAPPAPPAAMPGAGRWVRMPGQPVGGPAMPGAPVAGAGHWQRVPGAPPAGPATPGSGAGRWVQVPAGPGGGPVPPTPPGAGAGRWQFVPAAGDAGPWWQGHDKDAVAAAPKAEEPAVAKADEELADYERDRWNPIHFKPLIDEASNEQCLACHAEILSDEPLARSPAGVAAADSRAWYQTLDTYAGAQATFHARHLISDFANKTMKLQCNFCHQGNDPRDEAPDSFAENSGDTSHSLRRTVDTEQSCLRCHGRFSFEHMTGLTGPWPQVRGDFEDPDNPDLRNGCLTCHRETYRTVRHQVTYLKPQAIETLAAEGSSDVCYGCHGGRQWYRTGYPYPRHDWPGMKDVVPETPDWASTRPKQSEERYRRSEP